VADTFCVLLEYAVITVVLQ